MRSWAVTGSPLVVALAGILTVRARVLAVPPGTIRPTIERATVPFEPEPEPVKAGAVVQVKSTDGHPAAWYFVQPAAWPYFDFGDGTVCIFGAGCDKQDLVLLEIQVTDKRPIIISHRFSVGGSGPNPPEPPKPPNPPPPNPNVPNDFGVGQASYQAAAAAGDAARAANLATIYRDAVRLLNEGRVAVPAEWTAVRTARRNVFGTDSKWMAWDAVIEQAGRTLNGTHPTQADWRGFFAEVAASLEAVK